VRGERARRRQHLQRTGHALARLPVQLGPGGSQLEHVAEEGDAPAGRGHPERGDRRLHRGGVRVVAIVEQRDAFREGEDLAAVPRRPHLQRRLRYRLGADAEVVRDRGGGQEVREEVRPGQRQRHVHALAAEAQVEAHAVHGAAPVLRGHVVPAVAAEPDHAADVRSADLPFPDLPHQGVVGVEDRRAARGEPLEDLGLRGRDRLHGVEELQVHGRDHRDHGDVGPGEAGERPQLPRRRHAQL